MVTFRQSPCWYYPWADVVVSTSSDTQHLGTWWHFGDYTGIINLSVNNICRIHTHRSRWYITPTGTWSGKMDEGMTSLLLVTTSNPMKWTGYLIFITIGISCGDKATSCFVSSPFDPGRIFLVGGDAWVYWKALHCGLSSCPSWPVIKNCPFLILDEKYRMSSCTTCLIRNWDLAVDLIDWLGTLSIISWISPTNLHLFFSEPFGWGFRAAAHLQSSLDSDNSLQILCTVPRLTLKYNEIFLWRLLGILKQTKRKHDNNSLNLQWFTHHIHTHTYSIYIYCVRVF